MIESYEVATVRAAEAVVLAQVPPGALMQRAASALAVAVVRELRRCRARVTGARVVLLVGSGDNGGDALWAGARLARRGIRVDAVLLGGRAHPEGLAALTGAGGRVARPGAEPGARGGCPLELLRAADLIVDGVVGLGAAPGLRPVAAALVTQVPAGVPVVAVDLPSGVDPDSGETPGPFLPATLTVTFGTAKPCLLLPPAAHAAGRVEVVDLGLRPYLSGKPSVTRLDPADVAAAFPVPGRDQDKYRRGVLGVVAGTDRYPGVAVLACAGALATGVGMVRYLGPATPTALVLASHPEVVPGPGRVQAHVLGCGVDPGDGERLAEIRAALATGLPAVADAGALAALPARCDGPVLATPHAGELARLLTDRGLAATREQVEERPLWHARRAAAETGATVLLKGAVTVVADPSGSVRTAATAPAWLATAGAGDVLAGIAGALLAAGLTPFAAGSLAAVLHGLAARAAGRGGPVTASAVARAVPEVVAACLRGAPGPDGTGRVAGAEEPANGTGRGRTVGPGLRRGR